MSAVRNVYLVSFQGSFGFVVRVFHRFFVTQEEVCDGLN